MLTAIVHDSPTTQGSKLSFVDKGGHVRTKEDNRSALAIWRGRVSDAVVEARRVFGTCPDSQCGDSTWDHECGLRGNPYEHPLEGPVVVAVTFTLHRPVSTPKRKPAWPWKKPDVDKLERAVFDALKAGGAYRDDAQVVEVVRQAKRYPSNDAGEPYAGTDAKFMLSLAGTELDVMDHPGAVIRIAHLTEFPGVQSRLADAGYEPKDIEGGC
jgi:Endodeoxyribonuclease RusA